MSIRNYKIYKNKVAYVTICSKNDLGLQQATVSVDKLDLYNINEIRSAISSI
jgi:hypothetical protein